MRILMLSHGYPPTLSGVTLVVQKVARAMVERGHAVTVITASDQGERYEDLDEGVQLLRVRTTPNPWWNDGPIPWVSQKDLLTLVDAFRPDMIHCHEAGPLSWQILRANKETELPILATCYYVPRFVARYLTWDDEPHDLVESLFWSYSTWLFDQFDHVVFATAAHERSYRQNGLTASTSIISNGLDLTRYRPGNGQIGEIEARYGLPRGSRILFVSRLAKDKEIDVLIRLMPHVCTVQDAHLLLVGRGDDQERLEDLVQEMGLQGCVHFLGFVPEEDMPALYRACDLFAIASTCEVQSLPTLQAVATGMPVVAADAMALPELVRHGTNGFLVPPDEPRAMANAILHILGDAQLAVRMGQASLEVAQAHAEPVTFDQYEDLYRALIGG
jgi:glycosyltransferase involved in cell wall biosynthesis